MKLRSIHIAPIIFVLFIAGIGGTMLGGIWITESSKVPVTYAEGEFAGEYNPADIRGSYSFSDIAEVFDVPVEALGKAYAVTENQESFQVKNLEDLYGEFETDSGLIGEVGTDSVRWFVALYIGLPYVPEEDTLLPASASSVLRERIDEETFQSLKEKMVRLGDAVGEDESAAGTAVREEDEDETTVKGKTTFGELLKWGLSREEIERALGTEMGGDNNTVRDYCIEKGIEFSVVKTPLQKLVDEKN